MINLDTLATEIIHAIDKPFNIPLKYRVIDAIEHGRTVLIRRSIKSNKVIDAALIQSFGSNLEKVEIFSNFYVNDYKVNRRTINYIPSPIRLDSDSPFISVSSMDGSINFAFAEFTNLRFNNGSQFARGTGRYMYMNNVYLYHNEAHFASANQVLIRGVFERPLEVRDYSNHFRYSVYSYPMPDDMATEIKNLIITGELQIPPKSQEVTINSDDSR